MRYLPAGAETPSTYYRSGISWKTHNIKDGTVPTSLRLWITAAKEKFSWRKTNGLCILIPPSLRLYQKNCGTGPTLSTSGAASKCCLTRMLPSFIIDIRIAEKSYVRNMAPAFIGKYGKA